MTGDFDSMPDLAVLTVKQVSVLTGLSVRTLGDLASRGGGPTRVRLSDRRFGYPLGELRTWLEQQRLTGTLPLQGSRHLSTGEAA